MEELIKQFGVPLLALAGSWAVVRQKTDNHSRAIARLAEAKDGLVAECARLDKELAVLKSQSDGYLQRLSEVRAALEKSITDSESRVTTHIDLLVKALRS